MPDRLASDIAVVVGASSGIGRAVATEFASEGATVVVAGLHEAPEGGESATHEAITESGGEAIFVECDLTDQRSIDTAVDDGRPTSGYGRRPA